MNNVCRTCLSTANLSPLKEDESLLDKIELISSIRISLDIADYPTTICDECIDKLNQFYCFRKVIINTDNELKEKIECLTSKAPEKKLPSTKRKRTCDKSIKTKTPRNRRRINVIPTSNPKDDIKTEPAENDSYIDRLVICEPENIKDDKTVKQETNRDEVTDQTLDCVQCSLTFVSEKEFNIHKNSTHRKYNKKSKTLECPECNVTFSNLNQLSNHKRTTHTAPGICNICGVIVRADNLKKHVQKHSEGPVSCKICSKVLKNSESLRGHLLIHKGTSYECDQCEKTFRLKSEYHRHLKKHIDPNVRKKMCTICGKHVRDLQRHLFTHTGERPYICSHCNKGLTSSYALKLHIRQHTNEKPYICEYCSKAFAQKISLVAHHKSKIHNCQV